MITIEQLRGEPKGTLMRGPSGLVYRFHRINEQNQAVVDGEFGMAYFDEVALDRFELTGGVSSEPIYDRGGAGDLDAQPYNFPNSHTDRRRAGKAVESRSDAGSP